MKNKWLIEYLFVAAILFSSCASDDVTEEKKKTPEEPTDTTASMMETTAMDFVPYDRFPDPFYLDSIEYRDSATYVNHESKLVTVAFNLSGDLPQSNDPEHKKFNTAIRKKVDAYLLDFKDGEFLGTTYITAGITATGFKYDTSEKVVSIWFMDQCFSEGAAHFNHGYTTFNYDMKENKEILLTDLLLFKNEDEKQKFCDAFNPYPENTSVVKLETSDLSPDQDFEIESDGIQLYFDDYDKGPSMTMLFISYSKCRGYVNKKYTKLFR